MTTLQQIADAANGVFGFADVRQFRDSALLYLRGDRPGDPEIALQVEGAEHETAGRLEIQARDFAGKLLALADSIADLQRPVSESPNAEAFTAIRAELQRRFSEDRVSLVPAVDCRGDDFNLRLDIRRAFTDESEGNLACEVAAELRGFAGRLADAADAIEEAAGEQPGIELYIVNPAEFIVGIAGMKDEEAIELRVQAESEDEALAYVRRVLAGVKASRMVEAGELQPA